MPKKNLPAELPADIAAAVEHVENCEDMGVDHGQYWVIDQFVPRIALGTGVWEVAMYLKKDAKGCIPGAAGSSQPTAACGERG